MFEKIKWGVGVNSTNEIEKGLFEILSKIDSYRNNSFIAYDKMYNLKVLAEDFINKIKK